MEDNDRSEGQRDAANQYTIEDAKFIKSLSEPGKNRKWKDIQS